MQKGYCPSASDTGFFIEHARVSSGVNMGADHYHDFYEVYFFLGNDMKYFVQNRSYKLKRFDMLFIDKFTYHRTLYTETSPRERILATFDDSLMAMLGDDPVRQKITGLFQLRKLTFPDSFNRILCDTFINRILPAYYDSGSTTGTMKAKLLFLHLLLELLEICESLPLQEDNAFQTPQEKRVTEAVDFIHANYMQKLTLDDISKSCFANKFYLSHIFKEIAGVSIVEFITNKRLNEAEKLLRYSNESITMISETVGFSNVNNFIGTFKAKYRCTPKNFRKQLAR